MPTVHAPPSVNLPPIKRQPSPNHSSRRGVVPYLIVVHRPVGSYRGSIATLCDPAPGGDPDNAASAHGITDSNREFTQLVPWDQKAWSCKAFNSASYNLEIDDDAWTGADPEAFLTAARIVAFLCKRTGIPPTWSTSPTHKPGIVRHYDLGISGGGHTDPTLDVKVWTRFTERVGFEFDHGGFLPAYGIGELRRIDI